MILLIERVGGAMLECMTMNDEDILQALRAVHDPEIGLNIVDLGLVYRATHTPDEIAVAMTMTTPSCPLGDMLTTQAQEILRERFPNIPRILVELVWDPPWSPERMSEEGRRQLRLSP